MVDIIRKSVPGIHSVPPDMAEDYADRVMRGGGTVVRLFIDREFLLNLLKNPGKRVVITLDQSTLDKESKTALSGVITVS